MLLTGTFHRTLDEKLRFAIPKPLREALGFPEESNLYVAPGTEGTLVLYPEPSLTRLAEKLERGTSNAKDVRDFCRAFFPQVRRVEIDKLGRVRLPAELAQVAVLRKDIVLLGVRDHVQIWDSQRWDAYQAQTRTHYDELAERAFGIA